MMSGWQKVLLVGPVFLFSLCVHEYAHAWTAARKGDPTASQMGRLTLHPMAHADILGTLLLPGICLYYGLPFFGWAKPVPVDPRYFKHPRRGMAVVAAAGPIANLILAAFATAILAFIVRLPMRAELLDTVTLFTVVSIQVNLALAFFNLIPLPPLDGFNILQGFLPAKLAWQLSRLARYSGILLIFLLVSGGLRVIGIPIYHCYEFLIHVATGA